MWYRQNTLRSFIVGLVPQCAARTPLLDGCLSDRGCHAGMGTIASTVPRSQLNPHSLCLLFALFAPINFCRQNNLKLPESSPTTIATTMYSYFIGTRTCESAWQRGWRAAKPMRGRICTVSSQFIQLVSSDSTSGGNANRYPLTGRPSSIGPWIIIHDWT